ncbi:MAG: hypothetical protein PHI12_14320, partial [Dehalococcoidales bacterium]|nr:hypothetical protein [Dehalococcoidales bacterium]
MTTFRNIPPGSIFVWKDIEFQKLLRSDCAVNLTTFSLDFDSDWNAANWESYDGGWTYVETSTKSEPDPASPRDVAIENLAHLVAMSDANDNLVTKIA